MGSPGSTPNVTPEDVRRLFRHVDQPSTPITAGEVARKLECSLRTARRGLEELASTDGLHTKELADGTRVWWRSEQTQSTDQRSDQEEFAAFVSAVEDYAIFMLDPDGTVVTWNEGAARIKGYDQERIVGEHFSTFYTDADIADGAPERNLETAAAKGRVEDEGWRVRADGSRFWANVTITAVRDDDGTLRGFTKVTRDMTERREYELQLRRERDLTEQILETVPVSICLVSADGEFVRANQQMLDRLGIEEADLSEYSMDTWDLYDSEGDPIPKDEGPLAYVLETGEPVHHFECQVDLEGEGRRWLSLNAAPIEDEWHEDERVVISIEDVTDQKERERRLRREYNQTEKLLRTAPVAIAVQDAEGETLLANQRAQSTLGLSERELIDEAEAPMDWELYDEDGEPLAPAETPSSRVLETGDPVFDEELVIDPPDGDELHFRVNAAPIFDDDGAIERVITAGEDITELKRRERQLERRKTELETELSEVLDRISDAFYALDSEWRFTHLNDRAAELMQRSKEGLLERKIWDVFPDAADIYREQFERAMDTQEPVTFEAYVEALDIWLEFNVYPSETGLSIYFRDVTERKEREQELERTRDMLAKSERIADVGGWEIDVETQEVFWTDHIFDLLEVESDEEPPLDEALAMYHEEDQPIVERAVEEALDSGEPFDVEVRLRTNGGDVRWLRLQGVPETVDGDVVSFRGAAQDVTERKQREQRLEELIDRLEESNERLEQFAYAASHDLQEPLRMVSSYLQLVEQRYGDALDEDGEEFLEFAVDGADRMRSMIDALLRYSRVETRGDPLEPIDLNAVLSDVRDDLQIPIEESDADVSVESLPRVQGDPGQLRQVFQNLLDNALEYSGDEPPRVRVEAERRGDEWVVSVEDRGIGIDPDDQDRIFDVFQRLHTRDEHAGTGIGLALCERIVERHDGDIWVESEPGEGATFYVSLPVAEA